MAEKTSQVKLIGGAQQGDGLPAKLTKARIKRIRTNPNPRRRERYEGESEKKGKERNQPQVQRIGRMTGTGIKKNRVGGSYFFRIHYCRGQGSGETSSWEKA